MKEQGTTPEEIKEEMRYQLAETNVLAQKLDIKEDEVKKFYEDQKASMGLPDRVQLRVVIAQPKGKEFTQAQQLFAAKTDFTEIARQINPPQLKAVAGQYPQPAPVPVNHAQIPKQWQGKIKQTPEGGFFGPVDTPAGPGQTLKAWIKVEKKLPAFTLSYEDAKALIRQQLVQQKLQDPKNAGVRQSVLKMKMDASFDASDPRYEAVWKAVKDQANSAAAAGQGAPGGAPGMAPAAPGAPGG